MRGRHLCKDEPIRAIDRTLFGNFSEYEVEYSSDQRWYLVSRLGRSARILISNGNAPMNGDPQ
jgi:hypothetical protein